MMYRKKYLSAFILILLVSIITVSVVRAAITNITYDEAFTYIHYVKRVNAVISLMIPHQEKSRTAADITPAETHAVNDDKNDVLSKMNKEEYQGIRGKLKAINRYLIANNHILLSLSILLTDLLLGTSYDEIAIRLPVLLAFALYLASIWFFWRRGLISTTCVIFLCMNYFVNGYYGVARGYGMAHTFIFLACMAYMLWQNSGFSEDRYIIYCTASLLAAASANTIVLLLYPAIGGMIIYRLVMNGSLKNFLAKHKTFIVISTVLMLGLTAYHFIISMDTKPLYTGSNSFYRSVILDYAEMFTGNTVLAHVVAISVIVLFFLALIINIMNTKIKHCDFAVMLILFCITCMIMHIITGKGYITSRVSVPFHCFTILSLADIFGSASESLPVRTKHIIASVMCILCIAAYIPQHDIYHTNDKIIYHHYNAKRYYEILVWCHDHPESNNFDDYLKSAEDEEKITPIDNFYFRKYREILFR